MFIATVVVSILLAVALLGSAFAKLNKDPKVVHSIVDVVGIPAERLPILAGLEVAGAVGLIIGLFWAPLGIAAAIGVILYFIGAVAGHVRVKDIAVASIAPATVLLIVAVVALVLRTASA